MALRGRALIVLLAAFWASGAAADRNSSRGLDASGNASLEGVASREATATGSTNVAPEDFELGRLLANYSAVDEVAELSRQAAALAPDEVAELSRRAAASAAAEVAELSRRVAELSRPDTTDDVQESLQEAMAQEIEVNSSEPLKDLNADTKSLGSSTIVASVGADGAVSEEPLINDDSSEPAAEDIDDELVAEYDEDELEDAANTTEPVAVEAPRRSKRSSMVRSEHLSPGEVSSDLPSSVLADEVVPNSTASADVRPNPSVSLWKDFRTLFVLLVVLCLPMVAVLVIANLCMGLDIPKPRPSSISKFPHPAGLDAVRRRPPVK